MSSENTINDAVTIVGGERTMLANRYRIVRQLGQGGMGSVWLAEDMRLDNKLFAIKMLPSILVSNKRAYRQLKDEALVAMKLTHPNIVNLRAFEENDGNPFLVMDYVEGQTLDDYLAEKGKLSEEETVALLKPIAAALDYAHGEGVVHRDVKPANVMIRKDGHPFILDFGIAREMQETLTRVTGKLSSGTLLYMSPEQLSGDAPKAAQDVYSFSAMAYECLKGEPPFVRGAIEDQIKNKAPEPLLVGRISSAIMAGLAKTPDGRPATCAAVLGVGVIPKSAPRKSFVGMLVAFLAIVAIFGGGVWYHVQQQENLREQARILAEQKAEAERLAEEARIDEEKRIAEEKRVAEEERLAEKRRIAEEKRVEEANQMRALATSRGMVGKEMENAWRDINDAIEDCNIKVDVIRAGAKLKLSEADQFRLLPGDFGDILGNIDNSWNMLTDLKAPTTIEEARAYPEKAADIARAIADGVKSLEDRRAYYISRSLVNAQKYKDAELWEKCIAEAEKVLQWDSENIDAKQLKSEAERCLLPTANISIVLNGSELDRGEVVEFDGWKRITPVSFTWADLDGLDGKTFGGCDVVLERDGRRYVGTLDSFAVNWRGAKEFQVVLKEYFGPTIRVVPYIIDRGKRNYVVAEVTDPRGNINFNTDYSDGRQMITVSGKNGKSLQGKSIKLQYGNKKALKFFSASELEKTVEVELK